MKYRFFHIPARFPAEGESELNAFCAGHQVVTVEKPFVADGCPKARRMTDFFIRCRIASRHA